MLFIKHILNSDGLRHRIDNLSVPDGYQYAFVPGRQLEENVEYDIFRIISEVNTKIGHGIAAPLPKPRQHKLGLKILSSTVPIEPGDTLVPTPK